LHYYYNVEQNQGSPRKVPLALKVPTKEKALIERKVPYTPNASVEREQPALAKFLIRWRVRDAGVG
jgi:hypothetical protein